MTGAALPLRERLRRLFGRYGIKPGGRRPPHDPFWELQTLRELCPQVRSDEDAAVLGVTLKRLYNPDQALLFRIARPLVLVYDQKAPAILHQYDGPACQWLETRAKLVMLDPVSGQRLADCATSLIHEGLDARTLGRLAAVVAAVPIPNTPSRLLLDLDAQAAVAEAFVPVWSYFGRGAIIWQNSD